MFVMKHNKNDIGTYHNDKLTDFNVFCNAHWNYKTRNLKFNILRFCWNLLDSLNKKLFNKIVQRILNIQIKISDKLCKVYLNLAKPVICDYDKRFVFEKYNYRKEVK